MSSQTGVPGLTNDELFRLYSNGAIPPLAHASNPHLGLMDARFLETYQRGFSSVHNTALGVLLPSNPPKKSDDRWEQSSFAFNESAKPGWTNFCKLVRHPLGHDPSPGDRECERCDRLHAALAEKEEKAIAYLCCHGLIDFAAPVRIGGVTVAMLFTGQVRPAPNSVWPTGLVRVLDDARRPQEDEQDLAVLSQKRLEEVSWRYGLAQQKIDEALAEDEKSERLTTATPEEIESTLKSLRETASMLSKLATNAYELQKLRLTNIVRSRFGAALALLDDQASNLDEVLKRVQESLEQAAEFLGLRYMVICRISKRADTLQSIQPAVAVGLDSTLPCSISLANVDAAGNLLCPSRDGGDEQDTCVFELSPLVRYEPFATLVSQHHLNGDLKPRSLRILPPSAPDFVMFAGNYECNWAEQLQAVDKKAVLEIATTACQVCKIQQLLSDLRESQNAMDTFIEDVAHDIRAPIHNIITKVTALKRCSFNQHEFLQQASKISAAVMRIHLVANRVWTSQNLQRGRVMYRPGATTGVEEAVRKVVDALGDIAKNERVDFDVFWRELATIPVLKIDPEMFFEVLLNLIHNAVRYSVPIGDARNPRVEVHAALQGQQALISVGNRGIGIPKEEADRIFERYYRTPEARRFKPDGSGIGLSIVRDFIDHYSGTIDVSSEPIQGTVDYLTIMTLRLNV